MKFFNEEQIRDLRDECLDGFKTVEFIDKGDDGVYSRIITIIAQDLATNNFYEVWYYQGQGKHAEDYFEDINAEEVMQVEKTVVVKEWEHV